MKQTAVSAAPRPGSSVKRGNGLVSTHKVDQTRKERLYERAHLFCGDIYLKGYIVFLPK
jgi:hypothetical protein